MDELLGAFANLSTADLSDAGDALLLSLLEDVLRAGVEAAVAEGLAECEAEAPEQLRLTAVAEEAVAEAGEATAIARRADFSAAERVLHRRAAGAGGGGGSSGGGSSSSSSSSSSSTVVARGFQMDLLGKDIATLQGGVWLNDEVVNFWFELLRERSLARSVRGRQAAASAASAGAGAAAAAAAAAAPAPANAGLVSAAAPRPDLFWNSFFCQKLAGGPGGYSYASVKRWAKPAILRRRYAGWCGGAGGGAGGGGGGGGGGGCICRAGGGSISVFDFERVLMPVHAGGNHWCLAVVFVRARRIAYLDSLGAGSGEALLRALLRWLRDESRERLGQELEAATGGRWELGGAPPVGDAGCFASVPQQHNGSDCGVFACAAADFISNGDAALGYSQADMAPFRHRMQVRILQGPGSLVREAGLAKLR